MFLKLESYSERNKTVGFLRCSALECLLKQPTEKPTARPNFCISDSQPGVTELTIRSDTTWLRGLIVKVLDEINVKQMISSIYSDILFYYFVICNILFYAPLNRLEKLII